MRLSPLNFSRLIANKNGLDSANKSGLEPRQVWQCAACEDTHDCYRDAKTCCHAGDDVSCPICEISFQGSITAFRDAADCCLWKDLDALTRWRIADAVEAGSTWVEELLRQPP